MAERSFPLPSQIDAVPGAEGWEEMYPYFTRFQPEDDQRFWFYNSMHFPEVVPAFDGVTSEIPYTAIGANTARLFSFPTTLGIEYRILNGRVHHRQPGARRGGAGEAVRRLPGTGRVLLRELGPDLRRVAAAHRGADRR